jgi:RNA polymerase sigma-70 factor (ECF subfamily)
MTGDRESENSSCFSSLERRLQDGDESAAREVFERYAARLIGLARSRLGPHLNGKIDPEDVVQSVFRSFFDRQRKGQFDLANWDGLWSLLIRITLRKCGRKLERFTAAKRDVRQDIRGSDPSDDSYLNWIAIDRAPTADEALQLREIIERLVSTMRDPKERTTLDLRLQGFRVHEIAEQLGCTERTVHRKLDRIKSNLVQILERS